MDDNLELGFQDIMEFVANTRCDSPAETATNQPHDERRAYENVPV